MSAPPRPTSHGPAIKVAVGLGSNQAQPQQQIQTAFTELDTLPDTHVLKKSSLYQSQPLKTEAEDGPQAPYINAVALIETHLSAADLLSHLQHIEQTHGREPDPKKRQHWGPRPLDLDILSYGNQPINTQQLTVPHPGITKREFVLIPWAQIAPETEIAGLGQIQRLAACIPRRGIQRLDNPKLGPIKSGIESA